MSTSNNSATLKAAAVVVVEVTWGEAGPSVLVCQQKRSEFESCRLLKWSIEKEVFYYVTKDTNEMKQFLYQTAGQMTSGDDWYRIQVSVEQAIQVCKIPLAFTVFFAVGKYHFLRKGLVCTSVNKNGRSSNPEAVVVWRRLVYLESRYRYNKQSISVRFPSFHSVLCYR